MTLILAMANNEFVVQVSDRRLSRNGKVVDDESNKSGIIQTLDGKMTFGFTGIAKSNSFLTFDWILKTLYDSRAPDYSIGGILERFRIKATSDFRTKPVFKKLEKKDKKLAIMFTGFIYLNGSLNIGNAILSNFHNFKNNTKFKVAQDEFSIGYHSLNVNNNNQSLVSHIGNGSSLTPKHIIEFRKLLAKGKPSNALKEKAFKIIREIADTPKSQGVIGKQLTSIIIPKQLGANITLDYSSELISPGVYSPAIVTITPDYSEIINNVVLKPVKKEAMPIIVPKVRRNWPCPCGSKKKYKNCHGKVK